MHMCHMLGLPWHWRICKIMQQNIPPSYRGSQATERSVEAMISEADAKSSVLGGLAVRDDVGRCWLGYCLVLTVQVACPKLVSHIMVF